ncbi:uncharacterized protein LOC124654900 [Lolium rigidum]|uniref:uncharacterized protein LOC124654900 n=1 Tax=Lolium rigidum TaxID=89674 RepID=UPI001F5D83D8|nr:uncharacterized protein LOC124654900 [Lolium rigidum]
MSIYIRSIISRMWYRVEATGLGVRTALNSEDSAPVFHGTDGVHHMLNGAESLFSCSDHLNFISTRPKAKSAPGSALTLLRLEHSTDATTAPSSDRLRKKIVIIYH